MEEDVPSPVNLCSAPPSPPFPSVTPSDASDGSLVHRRRSGRIQAIRSYTREKQSVKSSRFSSSVSQTKRSWERTNMVQVSEAKQPRVDDSQCPEGRVQNDFGFGSASEPPAEPRLQTLTGMDACSVDRRAEPPPPQLHLDMLGTSGATAAEQAEQSMSASRSWVIAPLFQSFRSKIATFTEIVMSPVKLFRDPRPPPSPTNNYRPQDKGGESNLLQRCQEDATVPAAVKCSKKLSFDDVEQSEQAGEEPQSRQRLSEDAIPLLISTSACVEPSLLVCGMETEPADPLSAAAPLKLPLTRKCPRNSKKVPSKVVCPPAIRRRSETHARVNLSPPDRPHNHLTNGSRRPRPSQLGSDKVERSDAAVRRPAADCPSTDPLKKKKKRLIEGVARPPKKKDASEGHVTRPAAKTRADRKVGQEVKPPVHSGADMALETTIAIRELPEPQHIAIVLVRPLHIADKKPCKRKSASCEGSTSSGEAAAPLEGSRKKQKRVTKSSKFNLRSLQPKEVGNQRLSEPVCSKKMSPSLDLPALVRSNNELPANHVATGRHAPRHASRQRSKEVNIRPRTDKMRGQQQLDSSLDTQSLSTPPGTRSRLSRSLSCPELQSLTTVATVDLAPPVPPCFSRVVASPHLACHARRSPRRARRHTVCSLEVERELAPLCLRKEVFPSRRSLPCPSPSHSYSTLASCFLSSTLAYLSKKVEPTTASHYLSPLAGPASSSSIRPSSPSAWSLCKADPGGPTLDSGLPVQEEEEEDSEDTSSSSQELEEATLREEKALSDSEVKEVQKLEERGKVSSIRIRKALPKAQNNLTPMGLPRAVRLKKKEFSLEEIYTNKNFNKPTESRLETIFEVPLKRRNGSESCFGQRRMKRFLEFLEVGEVRKPRKLLAAAPAAASSRTRRGSGSFQRDEAASHCTQDLDSVLCAKLDQLRLWLVHDGNDSEQMVC